jgi:hypothetical protein
MENAGAAMEQRLSEMAALTERLDQMALAYEERDRSWLAELDAAGRNFEEERRQLLASIAALESQLAEVTRRRALEETPLPTWRPKIMPFRGAHAA